MSKLKLGVLAAGFTVMLAMPTSAFAIGNSTECEAEGGSTVANKGSDFCLIPIRAEEYRSADYDGNQLGVSDCPGDVLNDGAWCMIPLGDTASTAKTSAGLGSVVSGVTGGSATSGLSSVVGGASSSSSSGLGSVVSGVTGGSSTSGIGSVVGGVTGGSSTSGLGSVVGGAAGGSATSGIQSEVATGLVKDRLTGGNKSTTEIATDVAKKKGEDALKDKAGSALGGLTGN